MQSCSRNPWDWSNADAWVPLAASLQTGITSTTSTILSKMAINPHNSFTTTTEQHTIHTVRSTRINTIGVAELDESGTPLEEIMLEAAIGAVRSIPRARRKDLDLVSESARRAVRNAANAAWGKKPVVTVFVTQ